MSKLKYYDGTNWKIVNGQVTGDTLPIGAIVPFGGWDAPTGWLICDGTLLNKTTYPELFDAIGYSFGGEEGGSTFGLPDLRGRVPVGIKETDTDFDGMGLTGGSKTHTQTTDEVAPHTHQLWVEDNSGSSFGINQNGGMYWDKAKNNWANGQFGVNRTNPNTAQPMNIMNPYQTVNYIIKAKQSAGLVANVSNTQSDSTTDTYSCDYLNKSIICAGTTTSSIDTNLNKLPLSTEIAKKGSKFTISNGSIIIGAGVSQIIVSAQLTFRDKTDNQKTLAVKLNGDTIISSLMIGNVQPTIIDTPKLINVSPNDVIELYTYQTAGTSLNINNNTNSTYIMVQEV